MNSSHRLTLAATALLSLQLTACEAVKFVFKTGFWIGALVVVALVVGIGLLVRRSS